MSGGSPTIRRSPSTTRVSFARAFVLSFVCALAIVFLSARTFFALAVSPKRASVSSMSSRAYQMSRSRMLPNPRIASR